MKDRLIGLVKTYCLFICIFVLQKPLFMLFYKSLYPDASCADWFSVMGHGLPLDRSLAGYLTVIPGFLFIASVWTLSKSLRRILCGYFLFVSILLSIIFIVDLGLYEYWGFRLDATPLFYFFSSPKDAIASVSIWMVLGGIAAMAVYAAVLYAVFYSVLLQKKVLLRMKLPYRRLKVSGILLLMTGLLFIPIRGGFTVSTMNVGKVYFSNEQRLNHAAINPAFSLMESLAKQKDFSKQYRFMEAAEAERTFRELLDPAVVGGQAEVTDSLQQVAGSQHTLFKTRRPDILFVILESFSSKLMTALGGEPNIAIHLDSLSKEGILFTNFYANSFRTDRGLVAILSGYPAQPTTSIMKYPRKTQSIPAIAGSLRKAGYSAKYYYGGDADFTNMRSYLMSSGFEDIVSDQDFPVTERLSKWGAHDHLVFNRLLEDLKAGSQHTLFKTRRPDILFVILESFSSKLMTALGGEPNIAIHLDSLSKEGILFTNFYANSFRTDRGLVAILSGYPAQPTTSIMKYPRKTQSIPAIAGSLRKAGYSAKYYYGGDADFTNMRSYLMSSGFEDIVSDQDFPVTERLSKWGAHDHLVFNRLLEDLKAEAAEGRPAGEKAPHFRVLQTSSSHEPFEVPFHRLENNRLNAFAYTDSCAEDFVKRFRELPQWENTVIVFVPDHLGAYPEHIDNLSVERYQIPLLMVGGAVREPGRIDVYGSQQDIAATLLAQLALPHDEFIFSKDMLNPASPHFAFFTVPDAFGMVTADNQVIFNCQAGAVAVDEGTAKGKNLPLGKAYLQKLYDDIAKR